MKTLARRRKKTSRQSITDFAKRLLAEWCGLNLPVLNARVILAASGGADSTALLLGLDELIKANRLAVTLTVAHLDHSLRKTSKADAQWLKNLANELGHEVVTRRANIKRLASETSDNLEQAARRARYDFLKILAKRNGSTLILTAHTLDDQAETILLRLLRGSAAEGLSGTSPVRELERDSKVKLVRPLLSWARRADTESYCGVRQVEFRVDEMNEDEAFARVRVRKQLLPLMKSFNNRIVEGLSRTATLLNEDATVLSDQAKRLLEVASQSSGQNSETKTPSLSVDILLEAPAAVRRRALREWILRSRGDLRRVEMVHLFAVEALLNGGRGGRVAELPGGMKVTRRKGVLELSHKRG
ncbi:MAG: tRNA lysidine(34) synthetase TilS [Acidobacteriota bacterium]|nr:tRNA lysidine(34) synthetase TilS [Acidobacteriota bacterium]